MKLKNPFSKITSLKTPKQPVATPIEESSTSRSAPTAGDVPSALGPSHSAAQKMVDAELARYAHPTPSWVPPVLQGQFTAKAAPGANAPAPAPEQVKPGDEGGDVLGNLRVISSEANAGATREVKPGDPSAPADEEE